jgi:ABC-type nitrate/sulfonate/bicarbonate transport system permease component
MTFWRVALPLVVLTLWEVLAGRVDTLLLPKASETIVALAGLLAAPGFWAAMWTSHQPFIVGFIGAALVGVPAGLTLGRWPALGAWFRPHIQVLLVTPMSAVIPLVILVAGLSIWARSFVVFAFALPVVAAHAEAGMRQTDGRLLEMGRAFGATATQLTWSVRLPAAWPSVLTGLRVGLGRAFSGMIVGELVLMAAGIGGLILRFQADFDAASVYGVAAVVVVEAVVMMRLGRAVERRAFVWRDRPTLP